MKKAPEAFRTISEVADLLETPAHVLRFWESKFYQIRPVKRAGGRRYYRPDDVALINGIRILLQDRGMTIRGVQRILQEDGIKAVAAAGLPLPVSAAPQTILDLDALDEGDITEAPALSEAVLPTFDETSVTAALALDPGPNPGPVAAPPADIASDPVAVPVPDPLDGPATDAAEPPPTDPQPEAIAMIQDDLLAPPSVVAAVLQPAVAEPHAPEPHAPEPHAPAPHTAAPPAPRHVSPEAIEAPATDAPRLARALRALPRPAPAAQRDRLAIVARRIDGLLERMSEASGAGRW